MAFDQELRSDSFSETSTVYGVWNAVQSLAGWATEAHEVEVGLAEDEVEREKNGVDVGERDIDNWLLNRIRVLLSVSGQKSFIYLFAKIGGKGKDRPL